MLNRLYLASPAFLQNIALTLYGAKTYRDRFGGSVPEIYRHLAAPFSAPTPAQFELQQQRLQALLEHCSKYVPYYQRHLDGVDWRKIGADNLPEFLPKLSKRDLLENPKDFLSTHPDLVKNRVKIHTSGTSGTPLNIYSSPEARKINYQFFENALRELGVSYRTRSTTLAGRLLFSGISSKPDRYDRFNNTQYLSVYSISETAIEKYIAALNKWKPEYIEAHPSALFQLQFLARRQQLHMEHVPRFLLTSSETLTSDASDKIESFFKTHIVDHYGCAEMTVSAFSNGGPYYADPTYSVLEAEQNSAGSFSLITTGLLNFAMPLIRYEMGDCIATKDPQSPYVFDSVEGRMDDIIVTPEGLHVGRMSPAFKGIAGLESAQIVQEDVGHLTVRVVLSEKAGDSFDEAELIYKVKQRTSQSMRVNVTYHADLERGRNGKFKSVINNIGKSPAIK